MTTQASDAESELILERNLAALASVGSDLARRLRWPARSADVERRSDSRIDRKGIEIGLRDAECISALDSLSSEASVCLLGVGAGELLERACYRTKSSRIRAWDRDPWLLRLALSRFDLRSAITSGRLELGLGSDLELWSHELENFALRWHPRLVHVYREERIALSARAGDERVLLGLDQLLVEEVAKALCDEGYRPCPVDLIGWSIEELDRSVRRLAPGILLTINYVHGLAEFCRDRGLTLICWEIDPTTERCPRVEGPTEHCFIHTYRRQHVAEYQQAGFRHCAHLPLAGDVSRANAEPMASPPELPIVFIGSSLEPETRRARKRFLKLHIQLLGERSEPPEIVDQALRRIVDAQLAAGSDDVLDFAFAEELPEFAAIAKEIEPVESPSLLAWQWVAAERRRRTVASLAEFGVHVFGDPGWKEIESTGVEYHGYAGHHIEVPTIYRRAAINLDVGRCYQPDIVTLRVFDVMACGAFVLAEHSLDLETCFEIGQEVASYHGEAQLRDRVAYFLAHPEERMAFANAGRRAIENRHTVRQRVRTIFSQNLPTLR